MLQNPTSIPSSSNTKTPKNKNRFPTTEHNPLFQVVTDLLRHDATEIDERLDRNPWRRTRVLNLAKSQIRKAYVGRGDRHAEFDVQKTLSTLLQLRLTKPAPGLSSPEGSIILNTLETSIERGMLNALDRFVPVTLMADAPFDPLAFQQYLRRMIKESRSFDHPFYVDFLANHATAEDIRAFLEAELSIDGRFDDLVALAQLGFSGDAKIVMGENYYDELGRGDVSLMHTVLFESALAEVGAIVRESQEVPLEAYEAGNLAVVLASRRRYSYLSIGFLAATEFLVPHRFQHFMTGWLRNGLSEKGAVYHREHISIDGVHARDWFEKLIGPEVAMNAEARWDIARGVIFRLRNSERYLDSLYQSLAKGSVGNAA
jgi:hypothetical protein